METAADRPKLSNCEISVVIPFFDEAPNLLRVAEELCRVLSDLGRSFELVFVDDGSTDNGAAALEELIRTEPAVVLVQLRRNYGQTTAIGAGFDVATGEIIVVMDADLQNDPRDIPKLIARIDEGFEVASGWRRKREDPFLRRRLPSLAANWLIRRSTGVGLHDVGCMLKAYRRDVLRHIRLYGEMHRYLPVQAHLVGARIAEVEVSHRPRMAGRSKYSLARAPHVLFDLLTIRFLDRHLQHPLYFFGKAAAMVAGLSILAAAPAFYWKFVTGTKSLIQTPLPILSLVLIVMAVQIFLTGLMMEVLSRTYFESQKKKPYAIRRVVPGRQTLLES
ncbi:MAG: glycosyltransferase family 2 protein [Thermoanaerobaculia bacterium]